MDLPAQKILFRIQAYDLVICGYVCIGFVDFVFKGDILTDFTKLFSSDSFKDNYKIILKYIKKRWSAYCVSSFEWSNVYIK